MCELTYAVAKPPAVTTWLAYADRERWHSANRLLRRIWHYVAPRFPHRNLDCRFPDTSKTEYSADTCEVIEYFYYYGDGELMYQFIEANRQFLHFSYKE